MSDNEQWRSCFGGFYSVSNMGRVRRDIAVAGTRAGRILKHTLRRGNNYPCVHLSRNGTIKKVVFVHCLVAAAFLGERPAEQEVNHKNGIKTDSRLKNLEYVTRSENSQHALAMGLIPSRKGQRNPGAKLTDDKVREMRALLATTRIGQREIATQFGVSQSLVSLVLKRDIWRHVA